MAGWSQTIIVGNVGRTEELRYLQSGVAVFNFTVAVNTVSGSGDQKQERTTWFRVACWRQLGENMSKYVQKGSQIMVVGNVEARAYTDNSGQPQATLEITARDVRLLGGRGDRDGGQGGYDEYQAPSDNLNDIPF